jgi:Conserved TM helix
MLPVQFQTWGDAMLASVSQALAIFLAAIPKVIGFAIILVVGWFLATVIAKAVAAILRSVRFEELARRSGFAEFVRGTGVETDSSGFLALISKWFIRLLAMVVAFDALGLPAVSDVLRQMLLWLPNVVVGLVVLVIGGLIANALAGIVRGSTVKAGLTNPDMLANVARVAVWGFAIVVAVNQIGIAQTLINTLFMAIVGAVALAAGLAFGLGGRDTAGEMVREWRDRMRNASPQISAAGQDVAREIERQVPRQNGDYPNR